MHTRANYHSHRTTLSIHQIKRITRPESAHDYEYTFGPFTLDIKTNSHQNKRHGHWHLPDTLKDHNKYLPDHIRPYPQPLPTGHGSVSGTLAVRLLCGQFF